MTMGIGAASIRKRGEANHRPEVLVTGGAGFIGSHVTEYLWDNGYDPVVIDNLSGGWRRNVPPYVVFHHVDIEDPQAVAGIYRRHNIEYVVHCAAYTAEVDSHRRRSRTYRTNVVGSSNVIEGAVSANVGRFIFVSSIAAYGNAETPGPIALEEWMPARPVDPYGISKLATEMDLRAAHAFSGMEYVIFRPHNVYGPRQNLWDPRRNVVAIFMRQIFRNQPITIYGDGEQERAFTYIEDILPPFIQALEAPGVHGNVYNLGTSTPTTVNRLAKVVGEAMEARDPYPTVHLPARHELKCIYASDTKARSTFDMPDPTPLPMGLSAMAKWATSALRRG